MSDFVSALTGSNGLSVSTIWNAMSDLVPLLLIGVSVGVGFTIFRRVSKGLAKGKFRV